jgi:hypothetical protein
VEAESGARFVFSLKPQHFLDVAEAQRETKVKPDRVSGDFARKGIALEGQSLRR